MKFFSLALFCIVGCLFTTYSQTLPAKTVSKIDSTLTLLKNKQNQTDEFVFKNQKNILVFAKVYRKKNLITVSNEDWPEDTEVTYNVIKDKQGKVILIAAIPFSESGDWYIEYKHYFEDNGKVFAFTKKETLFDNSVKGGLAMEQDFKYYDPFSKLIGSKYSLTDKRGKAIKRKRSEFNFRDDKYNIYKDLNECLKAYNLSLQR